MMLEHTLVMSGETVDMNTAWQGWPAKSFQGIGQHQLRITDMLSGDKSIEHFYNDSPNYNWQEKV